MGMGLGTRQNKIKCGEIDVDDVAGRGGEKVFDAIKVKVPFPSLYSSTPLPGLFPVLVSL